MCSINFVAAGLNGCCFFHARTLFEMSGGDKGRKIIFSLSRKGIIGCVALRSVKSKLLKSLS